MLEMVKPNVRSLHFAPAAEEILNGMKTLVLVVSGNGIPLNLQRAPS
jgi:hypothetical protein